MWHYRERIIQADYAAEFGTSATLMDIVTQDQCHEVHLKDALGLRG
jgi:bacterioferritin